MRSALWPDRILHQLDRGAVDLDQGHRQAFTRTVGRDKHLLIDQRGGDEGGAGFDDGEGIVEGGFGGIVAAALVVQGWLDAPGLAELLNSPSS